MKIKPFHPQLLKGTFELFGKLATTGLEEEGVWRTFKEVP